LVKRKYKSLLNALDSNDLIILSLYHPPFLKDLCYMFTLESQLLKENKRLPRKYLVT